jgi:two-component system cell cycle response regulator
VLSEAGNEVRRAETAEQAFAAIRQSLPQIILLDLALPGMDGLALVRMLKADPATSSIPIVVITAFPDLWSQEDALAAGCDAYLLKPLDTRSLGRQVAAVASGGIAKIE